MTRLWTPDEGDSGLILVPRRPPLLAVVGANLIEVSPEAPDGATAILQGIQRTGLIALDNRSGSSQRSSVRDDRQTQVFTGRLRQVTLSGLVIMSNSRQKEPTRIVGHPDLASGASVQRGSTLYVSVTEAVYRESRGEEVEIRLHPTEEDREALADLRARARHRWENDRLPDGWTRPLPMPTEPPAVPPKDLKKSLTVLPEELRPLAEQFARRKSDPDE